VPEPPPRAPRPSDKVLERYEAMRDWRKNTAAGHGVDPDVIVSNAVLWKLAQKAPRSKEQLAGMRVLGSWKLKTYGEALLSVLRENH
jgi:superfamily II DNA helicase RecQ